MYLMTEKYAKLAAAPNGPNPFIDLRVIRMKVTIEENGLQQ